MTREFIDFVASHRDNDTARLLLSAARYPDIDMAAAAQQIEGLRAAREKWPRLLECEEYEYPPRLNREQASSEATARYKADLLLALLAKSITTPKARGRVADLTGGMGIDTMAFARVAQHVDYVERDPNLCALMERNCSALGVANVTVHCADSMEWLERTHGYTHTMIYLDPARRDAAGRKVSGFEECTPNLLEHLPLLLRSCSTLLIKASPMIDIDLACHQLGAVEEVHVVAVKGECKEVLFMLGCGAAEPLIIAGNLAFRRSEEAATPPCLCQTLGHWLYEPGADLMKAAPYRLLAHRYGVSMLAPNTHLYTSDTRVADFPGRTFHVLQEMKLDRRDTSRLIPEGRAHVITRNFPVAAEALQRQLGLKEGGNFFVVATTVGHRRIGLLCEAVD